MHKLGRQELPNVFIKTVVKIKYGMAFTIRLNDNEKQECHSGRNLWKDSCYLCMPFMILPLIWIHLFN